MSIKDEFKIDEVEYNFEDEILEVYIEFEGDSYLVKSNISVEEFHNDGIGYNYSLLKLGDNYHGHDECFITLKYSIDYIFGKYTSFKVNEAIEEYFENYHSNLND